jgi:hypothetical protein
MTPTYYIEQVSYPNDDTSQIGKAIISSHSHPECVVILGTKHELTQRIKDVLTGLNK